MCGHAQLRMLMTLTSSVTALTVSVSATAWSQTFLPGLKYARTAKCAILEVIEKFAMESDPQRQRAAQASW
ncbi:hypothetical protein CCR75_004378 [Bremia lactucae]|uniref:Secreted protein n=1 Tax=Bremia lactucae TaxID=4779 RepID=A0A976FJP5_BRELC|nr:hypothetical protein CCR75_004378 [Bremia lactucae]